MADDQSPQEGQTTPIGTERAYSFAEAAEPPSAPPRAPEKESAPLPPSGMRGWEHGGVGGEEAFVAPPGPATATRPPGERSAPLAQPQPELTELVARIESALETIHAALAEIKRIQNPPRNQF
jgi:hypothetical protein